MRFKQIDAETSIDIEAGEHRRRALPLGLHADGRPGDRAARDAPRAQARRPRSRSPPGRGPRTTPGARCSARALVERGLIEPPDPDAPGQFAWAREGVIAEQPRGRRASSSIDVEPLDFADALASFEDWWEMHARAVDARSRDAAAPARRGVAAAVRAALAERRASAFTADGRHARHPRAHLGRRAADAPEPRAA